MHISTAIKSLGITQYTLEGNPTTEAEFRNVFKKVGSIDSEGNPTFTDNWGFTWSELQAELARLQAEYDSKQYQRNRAAEYPTMQEQLDMQYWDSINGTTTWQDAINAIKAKYPKPE
jgi:predicted lipoprotein